MPSSATPLTDQTLARLRKLADGNGLTADAIQLIETTEQNYTVAGVIKLVPAFESSSRTFPGFIKAKNRHNVANFAALQEELAGKKKTFLETDPWLDAALKDLHAAAGLGWGMEGAKITLPDHTYVLSATEPCPTCHGHRLLSCPQCAGKKHFLCRFCNGTRLEMCPNCFGNGRDPVDNQQNCPVCRGDRRITCRNCRGTGLLACGTCQGKGGLPCGTCHGNGSLTQEITVEGFATVEFKLGQGTHLPAGLLRALDRLGLANLVKGHGDVVIDEAPEPDDRPADKKRMKLVATIPYADIKLRLNGKGALVSAFGKRGTLFGIPAFLDEAVRPWRDQLKRAVHDVTMLEPSLEPRIIQDALKLELVGKNSPAELRRIYSIGLSPTAAFEIMRDMRLALRNVTRQARIATAIAGAALSSGLFAALFLSGLHNTLTARLTAQLTLSADLLLPVLTMGLSWLAIQQSTQFVLRRRFKDNPVKAARKGGRIGYIALGCIAFAYIFVLALTPHKPAWLLQFFH